MENDPEKARDDDQPDLKTNEEDEQEDLEEKEYSGEELRGFARDVEGYLSKCNAVQPYEEGAPVWINAHTWFDDVMEMAEVPEVCRKEVASLVQCPSCAGPHDLWEEVGVKSEGELRYEALMDEWYEKHAHRLDDFYSFLEKYPFLGAAHEVGREIQDSIAQFPVTEISDSIWYRARRLENGRELNCVDFKPPDPKVVLIGEGRYNHHGQSALYLADDKDGAAIECVQEGETRAWVQAFKIQKLGGILDLSDEEQWAEEELPVLAIGLMHSGLIRQVVQRSAGWKPEYFIPRYIADCAREKNLKGILFKSVRHLRNNLVLFALDEQEIVAEGEPEIIKIAEWKRDDWRFQDIGPIPPNLLPHPEQGGDDEEPETS